MSRCCNVKCKREQGSLVRLVIHTIKTVHKGSGCGVFYNTPQPQTIRTYVHTYIRYIRYISYTATHIHTYIRTCMYA